MTSKAITDTITQLVSEQDYSGITQRFAEELSSASSNKKVSISYLKNQLPQKPLLNEGIIQGIVIGGTNFESALIAIKDKKIKILERKKTLLPVLENKTVFTSFLNEFLDSRAEGIGVSFAFPLEPAKGRRGEIDGYLIKGTKEHTFTDMTGTEKTVGGVIRAVYNAKYYHDIPIAVANDTICLSISGDGTEDGGLIVGTGQNISLLERSGNEKYAVNLESGNFSGFTPTDILEQIDTTSPTKGTHRFEKMISGQYVSMHFDAYMKIFGVDMQLIQSGAVLSALAEKDTTIVGDTARAVLTRAAYLVACELAGIYYFKHKPQNLTFIGVGSLLTKGWQFQKHIQQKLHELEVPPVKIKYVPDCDMQGALGLLIQ